MQVYARLNRDKKNECDTHSRTIISFLFCYSLSDIDPIFINTAPISLRMCGAKHTSKWNKIFSRHTDKRTAIASNAHEWRKVLTITHLSNEWTSKLPIKYSFDTMIIFLLFCYCGSLIKQLLGFVNDPV